jgi:isopenicillin-N N-acyltransferase-like protein
VAVVVDVAGSGLPAVVSPTIVCCLPAVGMNEHGGAQGIQSLVSADDGVGVPRVLVSRHSLDATDRLDAVHRAAMPNRAGGYGHVFAFRGGDTFIVETTAIRESLLSGSGPHTNHYLDPELAELGPKPSAGSVSRYERLLELIEERRPEAPEAVMDILRDHDSRPQAICRHPDPRDGDDAASVLFSMVCDVEHASMWVAPGNPCSTEYEEIDLTGVFVAS